MPRSTKLTRQLTDPLNTRITTIETRNLVDVGDNISALTNDAQYQTLTQVNAIADSKINALIDGAPATLDTLKELATEAEAADNALDGLLAVTSNQGLAITALEEEINSLVIPVDSVNGKTGEVVISGDDLFFSTSMQIGTRGYPDTVNGGIEAVYFKLTTLDSNFKDYRDVKSTQITAYSVINSDSGEAIDFTPLSKHVFITISINTEGTLPNFPDMGRHFIIKNSPNSTGILTVNSVAIAPGELYEIQWLAPEWVEW